MAEDKWTPEKPLPDKDDEAECQREAQARARVKHLESQYSTPEPGKKKRRGLFSE
jgi:hypothetical protein